jgi:hypothetical protein
MFTTLATPRRVALVLALAVAGPLAACGGGEDPDDPEVASISGDTAGDGDADAGDGGGDSTGGGPRAGQEEFQDAALEYAQCMRDHGVDMPDPEFDEDGGVSIRARARPGSGDQDREMAAAEQECHPILDEVAPDAERDPERQAEMQDQMLAVAECMRERGYDMPDPEFDGEGRVRMRMGEGPNPEDEDFEDDMEECQEEAGMEFPGGGGAAGATRGEA